MGYYPPEMTLEDGTQILPVHLCYRKSEDEPWRIACMPEAKDFHAMPQRAHPILRTPTLTGVTCPNCLRVRGFA